MFYVGRRQCKQCLAVDHLAWTRANPDKVAITNAKWRLKNPGKASEIQGIWQRANPAKAASAMALRAARKIQATPAWSNQFIIDEIYDLAHRRTKLTGIAWEADHIVPLRGKAVCGLHTEDNLRVIPAVTNRRKKNIFCPISFNVDLPQYHIN